MSSPVGSHDHGSLKVLRAWTRRLTAPLAKLDDVPVRVESLVGKGLHLLLTGADGRLLHIRINRPDRSVRARFVTDHAALGYLCSGEPTDVERRWIARLGQGLERLEAQPDWPGFLEWAAAQPATMLPDATFDPSRDPESGNAELIRVSNRCNAHCSFCSARGVLPDLVLETDQIQARLLAMRAGGRRQVAFTGGEPTLRRDLPDLIGRARDAGFAEIGIQTNGIQLAARGVVQRLKAAGLTFIFVPMLSHEADLHDRLMGHPGAFDRLMQGIDHCRNAELEVAYNLVVTAPALAHIESMVSFIAERFGAGRMALNISIAAPQGWALDHMELVPRLEAVRPRLKAAIDRCRDLSISVRIPGICGVPMCQLPGDKEVFDEYYSDHPPRPVERSFGAACETCAMRSRCSGFWTAYLERYGDGELGYS
jgi:MoaA/NifB/PqqE/SkfB family radical SAM enzyme